ncbi:TPA: hypothetical protein ACPY5Y_000543 [Yersinia enterocolitica]|uniref:hypothetical protein n=1 Tax=Yersinia enterocolitica TaxID=630 RepID=UPI0029C2DFE6|nr:hypothetical protein [Yersinia enterocolitica]HEI6959215.1 hypothetical protein [Yersinia enterocolitica]
MRLDNPAKRLISILTAAKAYSQKDLLARDGWKYILEINDAKEHILLFKIGEVMALPSKVISIMENNFESDYWKSTHWSSTLNTIFRSLNLNGYWDTFTKGIDLQTMTELKMLSLIIETKGHVNDLNSKELHEFKEQFEAIKNDIINSSIDENIQKYFVKYLKKIIDAIDNYQICGVEPIMDAIEATIGHAVLDEDYRNVLRSEGIGKKLIDGLAAIANAVTVAEGLPAIGLSLLALASK